MSRTLEFSLKHDTTCVALFGGVYSNHVALEESLADAARRGAQEVFCLGDLGAFGPHPDRVFPLLREAGVVTMRGNYDDSLARGLDDCQCGYTDPRDNHFARLSYHYTFQKTSDANKAWLGELPEAIRFTWSGKRVLLSHGSPRRMNEFLWKSTTPDQFLEKLCDDYNADAIFVTHTGIKWQRRLESGRVFVNVGVIGRPENDGTTQVWYTLLSLRDASIRVEFVPIEYDVESVESEMRAEKLPEEFIETLETGWWTTCLEILPAKERLSGRH